MVALRGGRAKKRVGLVEDAKTLLSEAKHRIALHDRVVAETKKTAALLTAGKFPIQGADGSNEEFISRTGRYETAAADLMKLQALLGYWADAMNEAALALNDHVFALLRTLLDDLLLLGTDYETAFDEFEVLMALQHADLSSTEASGRACSRAQLSGCARSRLRSGRRSPLSAGIEKLVGPDDHQSGSRGPKTGRLPRLPCRRNRFLGEVWVNERVSDCWVR